MRMLLGCGNVGNVRVLKTVGQSGASSEETKHYGLQSWPGKVPPFTVAVWKTKIWAVISRSAVMTRRSWESRGATDATNDLVKEQAGADGR